MRTHNKKTRPVNDHGWTPVVQPELSVNAPGDKHEQEADAVADKISGSNTIHTVQPAAEQGTLLQRKAIAADSNNTTQTRNDTAANPSLSNRIASTRDGGQALKSGASSFMTGQFGFDFNQVKIHTDNDAVQMNRELHAKAFTVGNDIYFNHGQYDPESKQGRHLLAHELTHVVQQSSGSKSPGIQCEPLPADSPSPSPAPVGTLDLRENASPLLASALGSTEINGFKTGSAKIPKTEEGTLRYHAEQILYFLKKYPVATVELIGHTDKVGTDENNLSLGAERAEAVKAFLMAEGVPGEIMDTKTKGETAPAVPTKNGVAEPRNRRVEVFFRVPSTMLSFGTKPLTLGKIAPAPPPPPAKPVFDIAKLRGSDTGEPDLTTKLKDLADKLERLPAPKQQSIEDVVIDKIMDKIRPLTRKLPTIPLVGRPEDLIRKALKKGGEALCEQTIDALDIPEDAKTILRESCKAGLKQEF